MFLWHLKNCLECKFWVNESTLRMHIYHDKNHVSDRFIVGLIFVQHVLPTVYCAILWDLAPVAVVKLDTKLQLETLDVKVN